MCGMARVGLCVENYVQLKQNGHEWRVPAGGAAATPPPTILAKAVDVLKEAQDRCKFMFICHTAAGATGAAETAGIPLKPAVVVTADGASALFLGVQNHDGNAIAIAPRPANTRLMLPLMTIITHRNSPW